MYMKSPKLLPFIFFFFLIASFTQAQFLRENLMIHHPFMGDVADYSGYQMDASVEGSVLSTDRFGREGHAYYFDGVDDYIILSNDSLAKPQLPISFSIWVKPDDLDGANNVLFSTDDHPNMYSGIIVRLDHLGSGTVLMSYGTGGGSGYQHRRTAHGTLSIVADEWQHVVGVIRGPEDMDIYINGQKDPVTYSGTGGALHYTEYPGKIGAYDGNVNGSTKYFTGNLDDFKLWNAALDETAVAKIYGELFLDIPMDGTAFDYSSNHLDGYTVKTALTPNRFGEADMAYAFDGDSSNIFLTANGLLKAALPISVSFWVNPKDINQVYNPLFTNDDNPDFYSGIWAQLNPQGTGEVAIGYGTGGGTGSQNRRSAVGTTPVDNNQWTHVVTIVRGPEDMDIYINGVKDSVNYSGSGSGPMIYSDYSGNIGSFKGTANGDKKHFHGSLDEFKMWNRVITEDEIQVLYTPGTTVSTEQATDRNERQLSLFPNPVRERLQLSVPLDIQVQNYVIFDTNGSMVAKGYLSTKQDIPVNNLQGGIYHIKLFTSDKMIPLRFVKI